MRGRWFVGGMLTVRLADLIMDHGLATLTVIVVVGIYCALLLLAEVARLDRTRIR